MNNRSVNVLFIATLLISSQYNLPISTFLGVEPKIYVELCQYYFRDETWIRICFVRKYTKLTTNNNKNTNFIAHSNINTSYLDHVVMHINNKIKYLNR